MLIDFQNSFTDRLRSKFLAKWLINIPPLLKRFATLPCKMFVLKNCHSLELSERNFHARLSHSKQLLYNIYPMMLASFCPLTKRYLQWPHRKSHSEWVSSFLTAHQRIIAIQCHKWCIVGEKKSHRMTDRMHIHQPRRKTSRQNVCTAHISSVQSLMSSVGSRKWLMLHQFDTCRSRSQDWWELTLTCVLQQFLSAMRQISSEFIIFQQLCDSAPAHRVLEAINFLSLLCQISVERF